MRKVKVTVTIDEAIVKELDRIVVNQQENRSHLIEEALKFWQYHQMKQELIEGYKTMAKENVKTAESNLYTGLEVLL